MITKEDLENRNKDDRFIYHYTNYNIAIENILHENTLLFNKVNKTNDPLEFENFIHSAEWSGNIDRDERTNLLKKGKEINYIIKNNFKICCFSIDNTNTEFPSNIPFINKGYCRARMWSQYGGGHKGVCLIFNREKILKIINNKFSDFKEGEISYKMDLFDLIDVTSIEYDTEKDVTPLDRAKKYLPEYLFQKLDDYKSEQEYRIAVYSEDESDNLFIDFEDSLEGIVLGVRFPETYKINIKHFREIKGIPVFQMNWYNGNPDIYIIGS
jgi:hypothetical protein